MKISPILAAAAVFSGAVLFSTGPASADADQELTAAMPAGYGGACQFSGAWEAMLAVAKCGPTSAPGGPQAASYWLYADQASLDRQFDHVRNQNQEQFPCPGDSAAPATWAGGQVACGKYNGMPSMVWTSSSKRLLGYAASYDANALHTWWQQNA